jgi:predicted MFS family arabinose efflux permease
VTRLDATKLSLMLLIIGVAGFIGTSLIGGLLKDGLSRVLIVIPLIMAAIAVALIVFGASAAAIGLLLAVWGLVGTAAPVAWWTWLARTLPDDAEAGGGLMVAVVQLAIAFGATAGGILFDRLGYKATFGASAAVLAVAAATAILAGRASHRPASP